MASIIKLKNRPRPFCVAYRDVNGKRRGKSFLRHSDAKRFAAECDLVRKRIHAAEINLSQAAAEFVRGKVDDTTSLLTPERYHNALKHFLAVVGDKPLYDVAAADVAAFKTDCLDHASHRTAFNKLKVLRIFFNWCARRGWIAESPASAVELPRWKATIPNWPSDEEVSEILKKAKAHRSDYFRLILLASMAGLRRGEMLQLAWEDLDLDNHVIRVQRGKSADPRIVPMHPAIAEVLEKSKERTGWLFPVHKGGYHHASKELTRDCCAWMREAGYAFRLHSLRHSFASRLARVPGMTTEILKTVLGHTSYKMTLHYMHSGPDVRAALVSRLRHPLRSSGRSSVIAFPKESIA